MRIFYTLFWILNSLSRTKINKGKPQKKIKTWESELPIFMKKINKYNQTLKFTKSPQTIIKVFDNIEILFADIMKYKPLGIEIAYDNQIINSIEDLKKLDVIGDKYIKDFINNQINIELEKEKEVTQPFLKESLIKKALTQALKAVEYLPEDVEMRLRITELEDKLMDCYRGG